MNQNKFNRFIEIARALFNPKEHDHRTFHVTFIIKSGKIQSIGVNNGKTNTKTLKYNYRSKDGKDIRKHVKTHSELSSVIRYGHQDCSDCIFINIRIDRNGGIKDSKPCCGCMSILQLQTGYKKLYYSCNNGEFKKL